MTATPALLDAITRQDLRGLERALAKDEPTIPARAVTTAGQLGWKAGLSALKKRGADLNASYKNYRALHALIQERPHAGATSTPARVACLEWLLENGADPELPAAWPAARALVIAAFVGDPAYVEVLKRHGAVIDVFTAAALGDSRRVGAALARDPGAASARDGGLLTALQCASGSRLGPTSAKIAAGLLDSARLLVDAGADVNATTRSFGSVVDVGYFAIRSRQVKLLELLIGRGLDVTAALVTAAWEGREDTIDLLLGHGASIDRAAQEGRPLLNELVRWGQFKQARLLLARGASPNVADDRGWTAVHQAASRGNRKMLEDLVAAGGDVRRRDAVGALPRALVRGAKQAELRRVLDG